MPSRNGAGRSGSVRNGCARHRRFRRSFGTVYGKRPLGRKGGNNALRADCASTRGNIGDTYTWVDIGPPPSRCLRIVPSVPRVILAAHDCSSPSRPRPSCPRSEDMSWWPPDAVPAGRAVPGLERRCARKACRARNALSPARSLFTRQAGPLSARLPRNAPWSAVPTAASPGRLGRRPGLVDKDQPVGVETGIRGRVLTA